MRSDWTMIWKSSPMNRKSTKDINMSGPKKDLVYLYCVTDKKPLLKEEYPITPLYKKGGIKDMHGVYSVAHSRLYAVVSKVFEDEFSKENLEKNLNDMKWLKIKVSTHENIIEEVMKENCVIPFKFATLFRTEDNLKACLNEHAEELIENLSYIKGKKEWGVKIYFNMDRLSNFLIKENGEILALDHEIRSSSPGKAFLFRKKKEELIIKMADRMIDRYIQDCINSLNKQSLDICINKLLPKEITDREEKMILNAVFLVKENNVNTFMNTVNRIRRKYEKNGLFVDCTGPWPPYNFCNFYKKGVEKGIENA
ncbi:MAG TPA: hypothetical protein DDX84_03735 [Nitrospiraceae bacterium]|nr:hypothetical protein [Nitrospiraceae bacterium]HBI23320.1 hypothetical protein [Nitrospiraceae bacterium]